MTGRYQTDQRPQQEEHTDGMKLIPIVAAAPSSRWGAPQVPADDFIVDAHRPEKGEDDRAKPEVADATASHAGVDHGAHGGGDPRRQQKDRRVPERHHCSVDAAERLRRGAQLLASRARSRGARRHSQRARCPHHEARDQDRDRVESQ